MAGSGLDLTSTQNSIMEYLTTELSQYSFLEGPMVEADEFITDSEGEVPPQFHVWFGKLRRGGRSVKGARNDEYVTYVDIVALGSYYPDVRDALNLVTDYLLGFKPEGGTQLVPDGGSNDSIRSQSVRPIVLADTQRFAYGVNTSPGPRAEPPTP